MDGVVTTSDEKRLPHLMERLQEVLIMIHETALFKGDPFAYISIWARVQAQQELKQSSERFNKNMAKIALPLHKTSANRPNKSDVQIR